MLKVELEAVGAERAETLANLFQFYVHDFADFWPVRRAELQENGQFGMYPPLPSYWTDLTREAHLIRADGNIAGFALLDREGHSGRPTDWNMGEFWVARHYRREGVGFEAALRVIRSRPGQWEIAVARRNLPAQPFWRRVAAALAHDAIDEIDQDDDRWNGLILRFVVA